MKVDLNNLTPEEVITHLETWGTYEDKPIVNVIKELQIQISSIEDENEGLQDEIKALNEGLQDEIRVLEKEICDLNGEIEDLCEEIAELKEKEDET